MTNTGPETTRVSATLTLIRHDVTLKHLLAEGKSVLVTFHAEQAGQLWRPTVEHCHLALLLRHQLLENFVPVGPPGVCARLQARDEVALLLQSQKCQIRNLRLKVKMHLCEPQAGEKSRCGLSLTFSCSKSNASCSPTAFMSVFCSADVMYMCISRKRSMAPPSSACSISSCDRRFTNHSNDRWSLLIQKKSTCGTCQTNVC